MPDPDLVRIRHMIDACNEILEFTTGKDRSDLDKERMLSLSVVHLLEIIGESASGISMDLQNAHPEIPWKSIIGMRNRLVHGYFDIDLDIVWTTVTDDIPSLLPQLENIIKD